MLSRRESLFGLSLTFAGVTAGLVHASPALDWAPSTLSADEAQILASIAEVIVPATDTPGAREAGVPQFIDRALGDYCDAAEVKLLRAGLARAGTDALAVYRRTFTNLSAGEQMDLIGVYEREAAAAPTAPHFFRTLRSYVLTGYFTSQKGATIALRYDPVPGQYHGCVPLKVVGRGWATA